MNKELLRKILVQIENTPDQWEQITWGNRSECGTTYCVAGWACALSGYEPLIPEEGGSFDNMISPGGHIVDVEKEGASLLGLTEDEINTLFFNQNKEDVKTFLREWSA